MTTFNGERRFLTSIAFLICCFASFAANGAERIKLIDDWKFRRGDADEPAWRLTWRNVEPSALATRDQLLAPGKRAARPAGNPGFLVASTRENYDDSAWETVDLPHDAAIGEPFSYVNEPTQSLLPCSGPVWYRKTFELSAEDAGKSIFLDFDGAMSRCCVWVNGSCAGGWGYGYSSFRIDATPFVKFGSKNTIAVRCDNPPQSSRWYSGSGLYRNVWLVKASETRFARWGVFVQTTEVVERTAKVRVSAEIERAVDEKNKDAAKEATVRVDFFRRDADGNKIGEAFARTSEKTVSLKPGESARVEFEELTIEDAPLWSPDEPNSCFAEAVASTEGSVVDVESAPCGIRALSYDADRGLLINGEPFELKGFCVHHDFGALGAAYNEKAEKRRFLALKSIGCNAIRLSHNPSAPETVDLLARLGFLVQAETFDQWRLAQGGGWRAAGYYDLFDRWSEADARSLVRRDRNCPAIVMWSIGNEIPELGDEAEFVRQAKRLAGFVREEDPTRPATSACNKPSAGDGEIPKILDVFGYNYYGRGKYAEFHKKNPTVPVYGSEVVCCLTSRSWGVFPVVKSSTKSSDGYSDFHQQSYPWYAFGFNPDKPLSGWACPPDYEFEAQDRNPFVCGAFAWTGIDYLGAPYNIDQLSRDQVFTDPELKREAEREKEALGAWRCPLRICETGVFDAALFPKDIAYLYKSRWLPDEKTTWIAPHWNFKGREGEITPVYVFTSGDSAELFLNDKSLGRKSKGEYQYRLMWEDVKYEPGTLRVVSYKDGEVWDEATVETTGEPAALRLTIDRESLVSDGRDLAFATVEIVDAQGRVVPNAQIEVEFKVEGAGTFVAADSGNATDLTPYPSSKRKSFGGLLSAIVRSKRGETGALKLTASAEGLGSAEVSIEVK